ncbi:unnamed protein product [Spodoptera exigua]|nr:unnamed protein product [Spodoptera exigua]
MERLRCANCTIATQRLKRHILTGPDYQEILSIIRQWHPNRSIQITDHICDECWVSINNVLYQMGDLQPPVLGHLNVCVNCGRSLNKVRSHALLRRTDRAVRIYNAIAKWILPDQIQPDSQICHPCWMRAKYATSSTSEAPSSVIFEAKDDDGAPVLPQPLPEEVPRPVNPSTSTTGEEFLDSSDLSSATEDERTNADAGTSFSVDLDQSRQSEVEKNKGNVACPKCGADFNVESREQENVNAIVARVYAYFAIESTGLSSAQLRQRTAALTGVSEADVQRALDQSPQTLQDTDEPQGKRRRIKEEPDEEPAVCVKLESDENKSDGEKDPLAPDVDMKPDVTETHSTHPSHLMVSEGEIVHAVLDGIHDKGVQVKPDVNLMTTKTVQTRPVRVRNKAVQVCAPLETALELVKEETEKMMFRVHEYLSEEFDVIKMLSQKRMAAALTDVTSRAACATGVSDMFMHRLVQKFTTTPSHPPPNKRKRKSKRSDSSTDVQNAKADRSSARVTVPAAEDWKIMSPTADIDDSSGETTDDALQEEPHITIKDEPLTEDSNIDPLDSDEKFLSAAVDTAPVLDDKHNSTSLQTNEYSEDVMEIKLEYDSAVKLDHTYHKT